MKDTKQTQKETNNQPHSVIIHQMQIIILSVGRLLITCQFGDKPQESIRGTDNNVSVLSIVNCASGGDFADSDEFINS